LPVDGCLQGHRRTPLRYFPSLIHGVDRGAVRERLNPPFKPTTSERNLISLSPRSSTDCVLHSPFSAPPATPFPVPVPTWSDSRTTIDEGLVKPLSRVPSRADGGAFCATGRHRTSGNRLYAPITFHAVTLVLFPRLLDLSIATLDLERVRALASSRLLVDLLFQSLVYPVCFLSISFLSSITNHSAVFVVE